MRRSMLHAVAFIGIFFLGSPSIASVPKITIITSVFNCDDFIDGFMEDITRQTIFDQCELIMVNAASPGIKEEVVILEYMKKYPNIVYVKLSVDPGLYGVWNLGVKISRAEYLTNANLDDRLSVDSLELHARALDEHNDVDMVYSDFYIGRIPNETFEQTKSQEIFTLPDGDKNHLCKCGNHPMWRKSLHNRAGLFDEGYRGLGDADMWIRFAMHGARFMKLPGLTGVWYHNPKGISTNPEHEFIGTEYKFVMQKYRDFFIKRLQAAKVAK